MLLCKQYDGEKGRYRRYNNGGEGCYHVDSTMGERGITMDDKYLEKK